MRTVDVALSDHHYPIHIGTHLLSQVEWLTELIPHQQLFIVTDTHVAAHWLPCLLDAFANRDTEVAILPAGEDSKSLSEYSRLMDQMMRSRRRRNAAVIALGGGVVGDLAGFVAATYQRGVDVVQVPTTLLSQVDSSVGGKTAVNHPLGKNMIGAFHQPCTVIIDTNTLSSLPEREFHSGLAEVVKYGVIADAEFFAWQEQNIDAILQRDSTALTHLIARSCEIKAAIVMRDPTEKGVRAFLNFGHTVGHAIEIELGYGTWLHGEAVASGMVAATRLALSMGQLTDPYLLTRLLTLLQRLKLPTELPQEISIEALLQHMRLDKKNTGNDFRFILPKQLGEVEIVNGITDDALRAALT